MNTYHQTEPLKYPELGLFRTDPEESYTLPASWYTDPAMLAREKAAIFYQNWWYFCATGDLATPGAYVADRVVDQEVFVIRGADDRLRGFYNVCSHRAHPLLDGSGRVRSIVCPYHQWRYGLNGAFLTARGRDRLPAAACDQAHLKEIHVESVGPMVFVNLAPQPRPLAEMAAQLIADMRDACPRFDQLVRVERHEREVAANWKAIVDNNHECYHCDVNHRSLTTQIDFNGTYEWTDSEWTFSHRVKSRQHNGAAYPVAAGGQEQEALFAFLWPNLIPLFWPGTANLAVFQVIPREQERSVERWDFYLAHPEPTQQERGLIDYIKSTLIQEDVALCERVQRGLNSLGYRQGKFVVDRSRTNISEHHVHLFQRLVRDGLLPRR